MMILVVYFLLALLVLAVLLIIWFSYKGIPKKDDSFEIYFSELLKRDTEARFLVIQKILKREFIQFYRYLDKSGNPKMQMSFPIANWSKKYEEKLIEKLKEKEFRYELDNQSEMQFIDVFCGDDIQRVQECAKLVLRDVFLFSENSFFYVALER